MPDWFADEVVPRRDFTLQLRFATGENRVFDARPLLDARRTDARTAEEVSSRRMHRRVLRRTRGPDAGVFRGPAKRLSGLSPCVSFIRCGTSWQSSSPTTTTLEYVRVLAKPPKTGFMFLVR